MVSVKCPGCSQQISDNAITCPSCGCPMSLRAAKPEKAFIVCPNCSKSLMAGKELAGEMIECPKCRSIIRVPGQKSLANQPQGKFSCPKCGSKYTKCERDMGCFFWLIGILTLGLLLVILYPFLPYECHCDNCEHDWKA